MAIGHLKIFAISEEREIEAFIGMEVLLSKLMNRPSAAPEKESRMPSKERSWLGSALRMINVSFAYCRINQAREVGVLGGGTWERSPSTEACLIKACTMGLCQMFITSTT